MWNDPERVDSDRELAALTAWGASKASARVLLPRGEGTARMLSTCTEARLIHRETGGECWSGSNGDSRSKARSGHLPLWLCEGQTLHPSCYCCHDCFDLLRLASVAEASRRVAGGRALAGA